MGIREVARLINARILSCMNRQKSQKRITLDDLAAMTARGFLTLETKMDERFASVDERFDRLEGRLDRVEAKHDRRLDILESRTTTLKSYFESKLKTKIVW